MKFRVGFRQRTLCRETFECIVEAEDIEDAALKFDAEDFVTFLMTERTVEDTTTIEGPTFTAVQEVDVV